MNTTLNDLPYCECAHCGAEWQEEEYWRIEEGGEIECPKCEKKMRVLCVDTTVTITLGTEKD